MLFLLALLPRLAPVLQGYITPDEPSWVFRSIRFLRALESQRWADTFQVGHPGVTTMWVGMLGVWWQRWRQAAATAGHLAWIGRVPWIAPENTALFPHLAPFLPPARVAMAVVTSLGVVGVYLLACRLWGHRWAAAGGVLLALDPFMIALSGLLHVDALAATFVTLGVLAWLVALDPYGREPGPPGKVWLRHELLRQAPLALLSGLCAGLGILSKSVAVLIVAAVGTAALLHLLYSGALWRELRRVALLGGAWGLGAAAATVGAFPAMWVDPLGTLQRMYGLASSYGAVSDIIIFFRGTAGGDPGPLFYPTALFFRLTPITLVGLALSLLLLLSPATSAAARRQRVVVAVLWVWVLGFSALISLGAKKIDRYLLPIFPALDLLAGAGWLKSASALQDLLGQPRRMRPSLSAGLPAHAFGAILIVLFLAQGTAISTGWPYYLDAYNPLAGGLKGALPVLAVGWGEGLEQVAAYLNRQPGTAEQIVAGSSPVLLASLFRGQVLALDESSRLLADHLLVTALDRQIDPERVATLISGASLSYTVDLAGQEVAWLYDTHFEAEAEHLSRYGGPGDIVLCDAPSPFARHAAGGAMGWDVRTLDDADESQVVALLNGWSQSHTRLWYLSYPPGPATVITASAIRRQLDAHAVALEAVDLGYVEATLYILPDQPVFVASTSRPGEHGAFQAANFGGELAIVGGALLEQRLTADGSVRFRLRWEATSTPKADYAPFVHLVDEAGHLRTAGRGDELLVDQRFWSTSAWTAGERAELDYSLGFPTGLPPGRYWIVVGVSDAQDGRRLAVLDQGGQVRGTMASVLPIEVEPADEPPDPAALKLPHPANSRWDDQVALLGYEYPARARAGTTVVVELGWLGLGMLDDDCALRLSLLSAGGQVAYERTLPFSGYPASRWRTGEVIRELYDLPLPPELAQGTYTLAVQVSDGQDVLLADAAALGTLTVDVEERIFELPQPPQHPLDVLLGQGIRLLGYDLPQPAVTAGDALHLTLYWRCEDMVGASYTAFVHLLDAGGQVQSQQDQVPMRGRAPTTGWTGGQIVVDPYTLALAGGLPPGSYRLEVGMYTAQDMVRLPVQDAQGQRLPDDRVLLDTEIVVHSRPGG